MRGVMLSSGQAYIEGERRTGETKSFVLDLKEPHGSGLRSAKGLHLGMFLQSACRSSNFENLSFPEIAASLKDYYAESVVLNNFPMIFDGESTAELRGSISQMYERSLVQPSIFASVMTQLQELHNLNNGGPLVPRDAYDFPGTVKIARDAECPSVVTLLEECRKAGVL
jgi:hypothetical protein